MRKVRFSDEIPPRPLLTAEMSEDPRSTADDDVSALLRLMEGLEALGVVPQNLRVGSVEVRVAGLKSRPAPAEEDRPRPMNAAELLGRSSAPPASAVELFRRARDLAEVGS